MSSTLDELWGPAKRQVDAVGSHLAGRGFRAKPLAETPSAAHLAVDLDDAYVTVSVEMGMPERVYVSTGVLQDLDRDPLTALKACNAHVRSQPEFPCFYAAPGDPFGADIIIQRAHAVQLILDAPDYFDYTIRQAPAVARRLIESLAQHNLGGRPFPTDPEALRRLTLRAM